MEGIKKYILQQELLNRLNKNQIDFFNTLYDDVNRTSNKTEKEIKLEILDQLLNDYKMYKINKTMDDMMDIDTTYTNTDKK
jgi:hypothetical protein